eukprot:492746-Prymnesium_polylepis.1
MRVERPLRSFQNEFLHEHTSEPSSRPQTRVHGERVGRLIRYLLDLARSTTRTPCQRHRRAASSARVPPYGAP